MQLVCMQYMITRWFLNRSGRVRENLRGVRENLRGGYERT